MPELSQERLQAFRAVTFRREEPIASLDAAIAYVNQRGYIYFWPVKNVLLPSLWEAVAGNRPVADEHDDPGHVTWGWKDQTLGTQTWYYAKVLRRRATFISLDVTPFFYALSENYGEPEQDYLLQYEEGRMSFEARTVYETLLREGPLDTISLRQLARLTGQASNGPFARALETLQADFKILPVGVAEAGAWKYAFVYDLVHRHYPELPEQARAVRQAEARTRLCGLYFCSVGAAQARQLGALFGWAKNDLDSALHALVQSGEIVDGVQVDGQRGEWFALRDLLL